MRNKKSSKSGIDYFSSNSVFRSLFTKVAFSARRRMYGFFEKVCIPTRKLKVIDVGVTPFVELDDSNYFEKLYPHPERITAVSLEDIEGLRKEFPHTSFIMSDGRDLPFRDKEFDVAFSSAVIEHVGDRPDQKKFIGEMLRVSKATFLTTPYRWFPVEVHSFLPFIHWFPRSIFSLILRIIGKPFWASVDNLNLLDIKSLYSLYPKERKPDIFLLKTFGLPSNIIAFEGFKK